MKSVVIVLLLAASAVAQVPAPGQGDWVPLGNGYYRGNSWVWKVTQNCYGQYCYAKAYPVVTVPVVGQAGFYEQALVSLTKQQSDQEQGDFLRQMFPRQALQAAGYANGYQKTSINYVQSGQTLQGSAAVSYNTIDVNGILHEAMRMADRVTGASEAATSGVTEAVSIAVEGSSKAAQIEASAHVAEAAIRAVNPPVQQVQVEKTEPVPPQQPTYQTPPPPPGPHVGDSGSVNQLLYGKVALAQCTACHSGPAPKGSLDLSLAAIASMGPAERAELAGRVANRIDPAADPDKRMPKGKPALAQKMHDGLLAVISQLRKSDSY